MPPATQTNSSVTPASSASEAVTTTERQSKKASHPPERPKTSSNILPILLIVVGSGALVVLLIIGAYRLGKQKPPTTITKQVQVPLPAPTLPANAVLTAACLAQRGEQYALPTTSTTGLTYDVYQGKIVAIEYLVGQNELSKPGDLFSNLSLPRTDYEHLTVSSVPASASQKEPQFRIIAYTISQSEAAKITCVK